MIRLNRTTEYGLMALRYMSCKRGRESCECTSAREIADLYNLPFDITAKTLQRLRDAGFIQSTQGARGGYKLSRNLQDVSLAEFLSLMEGPQSVVACQGPLKRTLGELNHKIKGFLGGICLADLAVEGAPEMRGHPTGVSASISGGEEP